MSCKNLEEQSARWVQRLQEYDFTSKHSEGRKHNDADARSRRPCHSYELKARADVKQVRAIVAAAAAGWIQN
jgi:hypothetical protein